MPIHENARKSVIGESAIRIIGSVAGYAVSKPEMDYGVDFHVRSIGKRKERLVEAGGVVDLQLKSTSTAEITSDGNLVYDLESKTYNDMVQRNVDGDLPLVLVVMALGGSSDTSVEVRTDEIAIKRSLYWYITRETTLRENEASSVRIRIPAAQRLDVAGFAKLMRLLDV